MKRLLTLLLAAAPAFAAFPNGYSYCKVVTTQHTMVSGPSDLTNYPLTVMLTDVDLRTTANGGLVNNSNGYDVGFYSNCSGSATALKWELESYSPTTGAIVAHVLRPNMSRTADDTIGMFYGGGFNSFQSTAAAVWDTGYKGVWHLGDSANPFIDSTANANSSNAGTYPAQTAGKTGNAQSFNGSSQYIQIPNAASLQMTTAMTISAWINATSWTAANEQTVLKKNGNYILRHEASADPVGADKLAFLWWDGTNIKLISTNNPSAGTWHHVVATVSSNAITGLYVDGALASTTALQFTANARVLTNVETFGAQSGGGEYFAGGIDELRISNFARSADWILTEYRNQSSPASYIAVGPRLSAPAGNRVKHSVTDGV